MAKGKGFIVLASGIGILVITLAVLMELFAGLYPSAITTLNSLNNSGKTINASGYWTNGNYTTIPLRGLVASDGVIPLILVAVVVILVVVGLFAFVKSKQR